MCLDLAFNQADLKAGAGEAFGRGFEGGEDDLEDDLGGGAGGGRRAVVPSAMEAEELGCSATVLTGGG
jgi:hypothetical protein